MYSTHHSDHLLSQLSIQQASILLAPPLSFKTSTPACIHAKVFLLIAKFRASINHIKESKCEDPFAVLSFALSDASAESARVTLPSMVHEDAAVRTESNQMKDEFANMFSAAYMDNGLLITLSDNRLNIREQKSEENARFCYDVMHLLKSCNGRNATQDK